MALQSRQSCKAVIGESVAACVALLSPAIATSQGAGPPALSRALPASVHKASATFAATSVDIPNPDRGFYTWVGSDFVSDFDLGSVQAAYASGLRLVMANVSLAAYRTTDLPASFLSALGLNLAAVRAAGMKVTLLFAYDFTSAGDDATSAQIARHLQQLQPVLAANADVIPYMRAGFIGAWGEWHSSQAGNSCGYQSGDTSCATADANRAIVRDALLANVPATTQIGFRYPADLQLWYPDPSTAPAPVGADNDCFLAGPTDSGTYTSPDQRLYNQTLTQLRPSAARPVTTPRCRSAARARISSLKARSTTWHG